MMEILTLSKSNFEEKVLQAKGDVLVDFWASWCGPCMMMSPVVDEIAKERAGLTVGKVNVDDEQELAIRHGVSSIPTLILFRDGKIAGRSVGFRAKEELLRALGL